MNAIIIILDDNKNNFLLGKIIITWTLYFSTQYRPQIIIAEIYTYQFFWTIYLQKIRAQLRALSFTTLPGICWCAK